MFFDGGAMVEVPELIRECFEPLKTGSDFAMCAIDGSLPVEDLEVKRVIKVRKDAAKILAEQLTKLIINEMKKRDTHNGYDLNT